MSQISIKPSSHSYHQWLVLALALFNFLMSALVSRIVFERLPHLEDEVTYLFQAKMLARGQTIIESPQPARAYWQPFVIDRDGKRFGKYPLGWPGTLAVGVLLGQGWVINAWLAALTVALTYRLGRALFNPETGLIAAALTAFSPIALLLNATLMGHTGALFTTTLFMYACWRIERGRRAALWGLAAGVALGLTVINRPLAALAIALPFVAWSGIRVLRVLVAGIIHPENPSDVGANRQFAPTRSLLDDPPSSRETSAASSLQPAVSEQGERVEPLPRLHRLVQTVIPLLILTIAAGIISAVIPVYQYAAVGDPSLNLYTLVWEYDQVGFGPGYGRNIHTLEKGYRQTRWDLSLTAADTFGWQLGTVTTQLQEHLRTEADYWPPVGLSWVLLPFGLLVGLAGFRPRWYTLGGIFVAGILVILLRWPTMPLEKTELGGTLVLAYLVWGGALFVLFISGKPGGWDWWQWLLTAAWFAGTVFFILWTPAQPSELLRDPPFAYRWLYGALVWTLFPLLWLGVVRVNTQAAWTWLLFGVVVCIILVHVAYWVGSQRYSTRYYFEALTAFAILSAIPLAALARRGWSVLVCGLLAVALIYSLHFFSTPRITALYRFNWTSNELLLEIQARREGNRPVLVLISGEDVRWRSYGSLMALTSPFLDSDIVAAYDTGAPNAREQILKRFPDRQVIEMTAKANWACFGPKLEGACYGEPPDTSG